MQITKRCIILLSAALCLAAQPIEGDIIEGVATVQDGDGLVLVDASGKKTTIRIFGIDAPETMQTCERSDGSVYRCGRISTAFLEQWVSGYPVSCRVEDRDHHKRLVSSCFIAGIDIGERIVAQGYARAYIKYSRRYEDSEKAAQRNARGFWSGSWDAPWGYRRDVRQKRRQ